MDRRTVAGFAPGVVEGVVARNSPAYLRAVLARLDRGQPVVTLRSESDDERRAVTGVSSVEVPPEGHGWVRDLEYEAHRGDGLAQVLFTSGTQGRSKGVLLSHGALADTTERIVSIMSMDDRIREYVGVPVYHSFGFGRCRAVASVGGELYLPPQGFNPQEVAHMLRAGEINAISAVPTLWRLLLSHTSGLRDVGDRVRWIEIGSQSMTAAEKRALREVFPRAVIVQHYGLTEASRSTFLEIHRADDDALESVGTPTGGVEISIGEDSAIRIRGPHLAMAVLRDGGAEPLVDQDSWFTTSDAGQVDSRGRLHFQGRTDEIINCGGVKILPERLEERIRAILGVEAPVGVSKLPDPLRGHSVLVAFPEDRAGCEYEAVKEAASLALGEYGVRAAGAIRLMEVDVLPTTDTGKLRRGALRELHASYGRRMPGVTVQPDSPRDDIEQYVLDRVAHHFDMATAALSDSILAHGGDSLAALELVLDVEGRFGVELALADLYRAPTVAGIAGSIRWLLAGHEPRPWRYLVPLSRQEDAGHPRLFIVGGSYGNVLHLNDLARGLVDDVIPYGIQYRGLLGDDLPRESLEETARDFLEELCAVQPDGPYLLGGYSGGGLVAVEMANQLVARGQEVRAIFMIDARLPARPPYQAPFSLLERQRIRLIEGRRRGDGPTGLFVRALRKGVRGLTGSRVPEERVEGEGLPPIKRRSQRIHAAFLRACEWYDVPRLPVHLCYFRPRDEQTYHLGSGAIDFVDGVAHRIDGNANGWSRFFDSVTVRAVPGGHYTLAHAPHAGRLADVMVEEIRALGRLRGAE